ncbi:MAG: hypothetical protein ABIU05_19050 [Nitrospirales bacterium]
MQPPSVDEFLQVSRVALGYLRSYGFDEVPSPRHRASNRFQIWFRAGDRFVIVTGDGYGASASLTLEHSSDVAASQIDLIPQNERPEPYRRRRTRPSTQLEQIQTQAASLHQYGADFLNGDLEHFFKVAKQIPGYLRESRSEG